MIEVSQPSEAVQAMRQDWALVRALLGGTRAMREAGTKYLPKWPNEQAADYQVRLNSAVLFPAFKRTVATLASKPFSKPLTYGDDVPAPIRELCEDVDLQGRNLHVFAHDVFRAALGYGMAGILVDYPRTDGVRTLEDERRIGARPYMVAIGCEQLLGWRASRVAGRWRVDMLRFVETVSEPDGEFGERRVEQIRVLVPGAWRTYRQADAGWVAHEEGVTTLPYVPFVPVYGEREGFMLGKSPLIEVAHMNVQHWQDSSDQQKSVRFARVRIAAIVGGDPDQQVTIGADYFLRLPPDASIQIAQGSAESVDIGRKEIDALEEQMRQAGAELLVMRPGQITATQTATENAVGMSVLQSMAEGMEDALDAALQIMADWTGQPQGGHVSLYKDFGAATLAEASAQIVLGASTAGLISKRTAIEELKRRGTLGPNVDPDTERELIDAQGPALGAITDADSQ